jgi:hypothetical protein
MCVFHVLKSGKKDYHKIICTLKSSVIRPRVVGMAKKIGKEATARVRLKQILNCIFAESQ